VSDPRVWVKTSRGLLPVGSPGAGGPEPFSPPTRMSPPVKPLKMRVMLWSCVTSELRTVESWPKSAKGLAPDWPPVRPEIIPVIEPKSKPPPEVGGPPLSGWPWYLGAEAESCELTKSSSLRVSSNFLFTARISPSIDSISGEGERRCWPLNIRSNCRTRSWNSFWRRNIRSVTCSTMGRGLGVSSEELSVTEMRKNNPQTDNRPIVEFEII